MTFIYFCSESTTPPDYSSRELSGDLFQRSFTNAAGCGNLPINSTIIDSNGAINMTTIHTAADLGRAIRARRLELGLQQTDLAMQSGVSTPTVSAIENGKETARVGLVLQLCRDLGIQLTAGA